MSKTALYIHLVFATKYREGTLSREGRERLYSYMAGVLKTNNCHPCAIGGTIDHIHILLDLHPTAALASLVREIKTSSSSLIKQERFLTLFNGWSTGYYAGSISPSHKKLCEEYILNQEAHHQSNTLIDEMMAMTSKYNFSYYDDDLT